MPLIRTFAQLDIAPGALTQRAVPTIVNTDDIQSALEAGCTPDGQRWTRVRFKDGQTLMAQGDPDQFLQQQPTPKYVEK